MLEESWENVKESTEKVKLGHIAADADYMEIANVFAIGKTAILIFEVSSLFNRSIMTIEHSQNFHWQSLIFILLRRR